MKFLCDEMLVGLGRWLRVAGYDTLFVHNGNKDEAILQEALSEGRLLLTRDSHFLTMKKRGNTVVYLEGNSLNSWAKELKEKLKLQWIYRPFSRCLVCNSLLEEADITVVNEQVPLDVRSSSTQFWYCPQCKKVYWEGSHTQRMLKQLEQWEY